MHGSWAATGHTSVRQALRCFSVGPCHACRRGRFRRLLGLSKVRAGRMGTWRPHCSNPDRYSGALDDRRARRLGNRCPGGTLCAAAVRTPNVRRGRPASVSRTKPLSTFDGFKRTCLFPQNPTQFVEPEPRFDVVRLRGVSPTCIWTVRAPLRRGSLLGLRDRNPRPR